MKADLLPIIRTANNRLATQYVLPKNEIICLISGYNAKLRMTIIKRLDELESKTVSQLPDFTNPAEAARAWADEMEQKQVALKTN